MGKGKGSAGRLSTQCGFVWVASCVGWVGGLIHGRLSGARPQGRRLLRRLQRQDAARLPLLWRQRLLRRSRLLGRLDLGCSLCRRRQERQAFGGQPLQVAPRLLVLLFRQLLLLLRLQRA